MKKSLALLLLILVGCGGPAPITGAWNGQVSVPDAAKSDPKVAEAMKAASAQKIVLNLNEDKSFKMGEGMQGVTGKWSESGDTLTLTMETVAGKPIEEAKRMAEQLMPGASKSLGEALTIKVSGDRKTLSMQPSAGNVGTIEFTR